MGRYRFAPFLLAGVALATAAYAHRSVPEAAGSLVAVTVEVDGRPVPLYPAPDGSGRFYVEARKGSRYAVNLANRTGDRVGAVLTVDGLNAISGQRDDGIGRMYVLDPWEHAAVQGWRTSLQEVRQFTFVDERVSYAARTGQANGKMGWIEVAVYRERRPWVSSRLREAPAAAAAPPAAEGAARNEATAVGDRAQSAESKDAPAAATPQAARSFPGTGWGPRAQDPVALVRFDPQPDPAERVTLRYEYRSALLALGVVPRVPECPDRLAERERGQLGFAPPPIW